MQNTTIKIVKRSKVNKEGKFPICLRITKNRKTKFIGFGIYVTEQEWKNGKVSRKNPEHSALNLFMYKMSVKAETAIRNFIEKEVDFTLSQLENEIKGINSNSKTVIEIWEEKINELIATGRIGNAQAYQFTKSSFFKFCKNGQIKFEEITPELLMNYEVFLRMNGNNNGGIGVKMREFRALYNYAIKRGVVDLKHYPFTTYKVSKLKSNTPKRALRRAQIKAIENLDLELYPTLQKAQKLFIFSYYTGGMNFKDMMLLRWENIKDDRIVYQRAKTKQLFSIPICEPAQDVINYYKGLKNETGFVFPILLHEDMTPVQIQERKKKTLSVFNKKLKELAKMAGIEEKVTSYVIRHSFATNLKFEGVATDVISEIMGHADVQVTQAYLKHFSNDVTDSAWMKLVKEPMGNYLVA